MTVAAPPRRRAARTASAPPDAVLVAEAARDIVHRHAAVGLALGIVRAGQPAVLHQHGLADLRAGVPVTAETVFRIGSVAKTMTAVAIMQLAEDGLVDLDAPANEYLRGYRLVSANPGFGPVTLRHLLTHTSGIPEVARVRDLFHPSWGPFFSRPVLHSVAPGAPMPSLAEYYGGELRVRAEPGSAFTYSNHGFATLGQVVEDVSGLPIARYLRERLFDPLGMAETDLARTERVRRRLAIGYAFGRRGPAPVPDREWIGAAGGGVYSSARDLARYLAALLAGGAGEHGTILQPSSVAAMVEPSYRTAPRLVSMGCAFFLTRAGGHRLAGHDGILPGFHATILLAPDDGVGVLALTNGSPGAMGWMPAESARLMRRLLGVPDEEPPTRAPQRPELWPALCGRYVLPPVADLRGRVAMAGGVEVLVHGGRLVARLRPVPALLRSFPLASDDPDDPLAFRIDLSSIGMGPVRAVFARPDSGPAIAIHTDLGGQPVTLVRRPDEGRRRGVVRLFAAAATVGGAVALRRVARGGGASR